MEAATLDVDVDAQCDAQFCAPPLAVTIFTAVTSGSALLALFYISVTRKQTRYLQVVRLSVAVVLVARIFDDWYTIGQTGAHLVARKIIHFAGMQAMYVGICLWAQNLLKSSYMAAKVSTETPRWIPRVFITTEVVTLLFYSVFTLALDISIYKPKCSPIAFLVFSASGAITTVYFTILAKAYLVISKMLRAHIQREKELEQRGVLRSGATAAPAHGQLQNPDSKTHVSGNVEVVPRATAAHAEQSTAPANERIKAIRSVLRRFRVVAFFIAMWSLPLVVFMLAVFISSDKNAACWTWMRMVFSSFLTIYCISMMAHTNMRDKLRNKTTAKGFRRFMNTPTSNRASSTA